MSGSLHLYRRSSGVYVVRLIVPERLWSAVGKREVHRSTGCRDLGLAKIVAAELVCEWRRSIETLRHMDLQKIQAGSLKLLGDGLIPLTEFAAECGGTVADVARRLRDRQARFYVRAKNWQGWFCPDLHEALDHEQNALGEVSVVVDPVKLRRAGEASSTSSELSLRFPEELEPIFDGAQAVSVCVFLTGQSYSEGFVCELPGVGISIEDLLIKRADALSLVGSVLSLVQQSPKSAQPDGSSSGGPSFGACFDQYVASGTGVRFKPDSARRKLDAKNIFIELKGDLPLQAVDRVVLRDFANRIKDIPDDRGKVKAKYRLEQVSMAELIDFGKKNQLPTLTPNAQRKLLEELSYFFNWAITEQMITTSPAVGLAVEAVSKVGRVKRREQDARKALTQAHLAGVFGQVWFAKGVGRRTAKGKFYSYRPFYFWLPLLAIYSGGRLNELSQLYLDDIKSEDGVAYIDFNLDGDGKLDLDEMDEEVVEGDKSLKNTSSFRGIPIHKELIRLGFLDYVAALRNAGRKRLFEELKHDSVKGYGKPSGKWFNDTLLGKRLGIPRDGTTTFHSLRHNYASALGRTAAGSNQRADLLGHQRKGSTGDVRYDKGSRAELKACIDQVEYPGLPSIAVFDVAQGVEALSHAVELKKTRKGAGTRSK